MIASRRLAPLPLLLIALAVLGALLLTPEVQAQSRDSGSDFTLDAANGYPTGIWSDETTMWVADFAEDKLYAYRMSDRSRDSGRDFTLDTANGSPVGIWSDGTTMWASDFADGKLYAYRMSDRSRDSGKDFNTLSAAGNKFPEGIWSDGTTMWVADTGHDMLFAYNAATMARDADKDFTLDLENDLPVGIWSDGYTMWVVDWRDAKLYAYSMSDRSRDAGKDFALDADDQSTEGLWSVGATMWVASRDDDKLYAYDWNNPATGAPTITGAVRVDETLAAGARSIADADGLDAAIFEYQWVSNDGNADTDIVGATDSTYTIVPGDRGRTVKVRVSFTDGAGNRESLTNEPTGRVGAPGICDRTPAVMAAIVAGMIGVGDCSEVSETRLRAWTGSHRFGSGVTPGLHLQGRGLSALQAGDFRGLHALRALDLNRNFLETVPDGLFEDLRTVEEVHLSGNLLNELPDGTFDGQTANLSVLDLSANGLETLPEGVLRNLAGLVSLSLSGNGLVHLPAGLFDDLVELEDLDLDLDLSANSIDELPDGVFDGNLELRDLDLSINEISELPEGVFADLGNLAELDLSGNKLKDLPVGVFEGLSGLTDLDAGDNPGSPFTFTAELERRGDDTVVVRIAEGATPFGMTIELSALKGELSAETVTVASGSAYSDVVEVRPDGHHPVTVEIDSVAFLAPAGGSTSGIRADRGSDMHLWIGRPLVQREWIQDEDFALHPENADPKSIWSDGETLWVGDDAAAKVFAYKLWDDPGTEASEYGTRDPGMDVPGLGPEAFYVTGHGARLYVAEQSLYGASRDVFGYDLTDLTRAEDRDFVYGGLNVAGGVWIVRGMATDGRHMWITDTTSHAHAFRLFDDPETPEDEYGRPDTSRKLTMPGTGQLTGLFTDGRTMWGVRFGSNDSAVRSVKLSDGTEAGYDFPLHEDNDHAYGIWSDGETFYVVDAADAMIYTYHGVGGVVRPFVEDAETAAALVGNTGQSGDAGHDLGSAGAKRAQAFTTGTSKAGYALASVGIEFGEVSDTSSDLEVTLNADGGGVPGDALCTLIAPASLSERSVNTFAAPASGTTCPALVKEKTYFVVVERVRVTGSGAIAVSGTASGSEDTGAAEGWSIADGSGTYSPQAAAQGWASDAFSYKIEARGSFINNPAAGEATVTGTPRVKRTLAAAVSDVSDDDGLTRAAYSYQWMRVDGATETNIGTGSPTYTLVAEDLGKRIKVRVAFVDDRGNYETLTSEATPSVEAFKAADRPGTVSLFPARPRVGTVVSAALSDPDGLVGGGSGPAASSGAISWSWARSSDGTAWTGVEAYDDGDSYVPTEEDEGMLLKAEASYTDGHGPGKSVEAVSPAVVGTRESGPELMVTEIVTGLSHPWGIDFTPDGTMLFTQRAGVLNARLTDGAVKRVAADLGDLFVDGFAGLQALAVDPDFTTNRRFYTLQGHAGREMQVIVWTIDANYDEATRVVDPLVEGMPMGPGPWHSGGRLLFGPEGYLWIATGDGRVVTGAQDLTSLGGKVLRVDPRTGAGAPGNPFGASSPVYAYGFRNPQGLALRPGTDQMWLVEHGPKHDDEINLLAPGGNYGWDPIPDDGTLVFYDYSDEAGVPMTDLAKFPSARQARWSSGFPTLATSGAVFLDGPQWGEWEGRLAVATLKTKSLRVFEFTEQGDFAGQIVVPELDGSHGRLRTPVLGPDGALYIATSNRPGSDRILRVSANRAATGAPVISGTVEVGESLTAVVSGIADPDGLDDDAFRFQWVRSHFGSNSSDIEGATASTYTLVTADFGKTISVRVSFYDDRGSLEALTSQRTVNVSVVACTVGEHAPAATAVEVQAVPAIVESTTEEYFVLYVRPALDSDREFPVSVTLGEDGTTTLTEQLSPLPKEHYRVEKFLIADPADLDNDCIDDITELGDPVGMNPLNPARAVPFRDGAVAIPDRETFEALSHKGRDVPYHPRLQDLEFVKFYIIGVATDNMGIYFMNTKTHRIHPDFGNAIGLWDDPLWGQGYMGGEIIYHPNVVAPDGSLGVYRYQFQPMDVYPFDYVARSYEVLAASMPLLDDNLAYYPMPRRALPLYHRERALYDDSRINVVLREDILPDVPFLPLNVGEGYGFLRLMSLEERPDPRDVVIYETIPNELSRVAGLITTVPQTPLSHVNLRAVQDGVPNAFIRDALDDSDIDDLIGRYVHYSVTADGYSIRAATPAEVEAYFAASRPPGTQTPERDLTVTQITDLDDIGFYDWNAFGVKAANVAVLGTLGFPDGTVPDGFAVPFYFYDEFMKHNGFYDDIEEMLEDPDFQSDYDTQEKELKKLRKKIKKGETPDWIIDALEEMHATYPEGQSLRYRSSTNNEDLPGFSRAGLYDSKTQDPEETEEDGIDKSIKGVWASLWNFRAFTEREFHRIDHLATAMGVLVHPNYSDELANGVAVSFDPIYKTDGSYYLNTQLGEDLVTNPDAHSVPEEILLDLSGSYTTLVTSDQVPRGQLLMSDAQIDQLRRHLQDIHDHFEGLYNPGPDEPFAMEIEFKITSDDVLSIKQARPWVFGVRNAPGHGGETPEGEAIWSATLTVGSAKDFAGYSSFAQGEENNTLGALSSDTITLDDASYTVKALGVLNGKLILSVMPKLTADFVLAVGTDEFASTDASTLEGDSIIQFQWNDRGLDLPEGEEVAVRLAAPDDGTPATGLPVITGTARVGQTLTADTSGIADADGLTNPTFTYQWTRTDGTTDTDITGETSSTHTVTEEDAGNHLKVSVTFTDDLENIESLTSTTTKAVGDYDTDEDRLIEITTLQQLHAVRHDLDGNGIPTDDGMASYAEAFPASADQMGCPGTEGCMGYELMADLDFDTNGSAGADSADAYWNDGAGWTPIGGDGSRTSYDLDTMVNPFLAIFEGNGHSLSNLFINRLNPFTGMFGYIGSDSESGAVAVIRNLNLVDINVTGNHYTGGLVAVSRGVITHTQVDGLVAGGDFVGGLVGQNDGVIADSHLTGCVSGDGMVGGVVGRSYGAITNSSLTGCVSGTDYVGGLVGNNYGPISASHTEGQVSGNTVVGGLVGSHKGTITASRSSARVLATGSAPVPQITGGLVGDNRGAITVSYATGDVSGKGWVGGLVGQSDSGWESNSAITASYATGRVSGTTKVGGLVGTNGGAIAASYARGEVSGNDKVGGMSGSNDGTITASYWDTTVSGQSSGNDGEGKTTEELQTPTGYSDIYEPWNLESNDIAGSPLDLGSATQHLALAAGLDTDSDHVLDYPWDLGSSSQYPALAADLNGDGRATWQEFGHQLRAVPVLTATVPTGQESFELTWTPVDTSHWSLVPRLTYTLYRDDGDTVEAIAEQLEGLKHTDNDVTSGEAYAYQVVATISGGETAHSAWVSATLETNTPATGAPTISGTARVDQTLTADTSGIADEDGLDNATFTYQWLADDANIDGATDSRYTLTSSDEGKAIKVKVSFTDDANNEETLTSAATAAVAARPNTQATGTLSISGTAQVGQTLTADTSGISDADGLTNATYSYQWTRSDGNIYTDIRDAAASTYTLVSDDVGKTIQVRVSFTDDAGNEETSTSAATNEVAEIPAGNSPATGVPTITGTVLVGETLATDTSGVSDADGLDNATFSYQWLANDEGTDADIQDATDPAYVLGADDEGKAIKVKVSFTDDAGNEETLTSAATAAVAARANNPPTGAPVIIGTTEQGETLTADTSGITDIDGLTNAAFSYQWIRNGDTDGDTDIIDATDPTYELTSADLGRTIKVRVSFTDDAGNSKSLTSAGTDEVGEAKLDPCSGGGYYPVPVDVAVAAVPIVVDSTTEEYFVLYVRPDLDSDREIPVSVTLGQNGTTTLTEQLSALPREHYRVEKYLIADPSDVDGDCIDDIGELQDPVGLNPLNPAPAIPSRNGAVAIPDHETFEALSYKGKSVSTDIHLTDLEYVKFYLLGRDTDRPSVYFVNTVRHRAHIDFGNAIDLWEAPIWRPRWAMAGAIIYHPNVIAPDGSLGVYRYEFRPLNSYSFDSVAYSYEVLAASMPLLDNNLAYYPMPARASPLYREEEALYDDSRINVLFEEDILPDVDFIPLNLGEGYGFLRVMSLEERPNPRDIVIYETLPNELSRVAGIITTVPQTPLSHVNLRAVQDGVPNAFIRDALDDADIEDLVGGYVHYTVEESGYSIRAATRAEVDAHYAASSPSQAHSPERDLTVTQITALSDIEFEDWTAFGVKAANVAVLGALYFPEGTVPDGFAVPFYFYDEFMKHNEFYDDIEKMLADSDFQSDFDTQESELKKLRKRIKKGETPEWINTALTEMHAEFPAGTSLRYRSSTNNEDLPGFSGAGLYDSKTQHPEETEEDGISKSLKQVYASLWNFRAFTEREFHRIDHLAMAMGVLVHPNYSDELANGVAVSFDPVSGGDESYYVNTQVGEDLVTNPDAYSVPEEILLHQGGDYTVLATSNQVQRGQLLMSDAQMDQLRRHLEVIHDEFEVLYGVEADEPFAMEIEFKITSDDILSIKQARPWVFEAAPSENNPATGAPSIRGTAQVDQTLTADTSGIADADGLVNVSFSYQWIRNDGTTETDIENATSSTYTLSDTDVGETIKVRVSFTDDRGYEETLTSAATTAITGPNTPATGSPTISGTAQVDETLTADVSGVTDADGLDNVSYTYQWIANDGTTDTDIENATAATYTPVIDDQGKTIKVRVSFTDDANNSETLSSEATATVATASQWRADMSVVDYGTGAIGAASADLFSNVGGNAGLQAKWLWYYSPERKLRLAFTERVPGTEELTLQVGDVALALQPGDATYSWEDVDIDWEDGQTLTARIVRARANAVVAPNSPATGAPTINGTAQVGETLTADTSGIVDADGLTNVSYSYQWIRNDGTTDTDIQGATSSTYTLVSADEGKTIKVRVSFTDDAGHSETLTSGTTNAVAARANSPATGLATISGTAQVGEVLTADTPGIVDADGLTSVSYSYQWIRNDGNTDADIGGQTASTYTLVTTDQGKTIKVKVSFTDDQGNEETLTSAATAEVAAKPNSAPTGLPTINGTAQVGETLSADTSAIADEDGLTNVSYSYQWIRNDGETDTDVEGATDATYQLSGGEVGETIKVRVSFTDDADHEETLTSAATGVVAAKPNSPATGAPTIDGTAQVGETLTALTNGIADEDGLTNVSYSHQWIRNDGTNDADIGGQTGSTYTLTDEDVGKSIKVRVSFTDDADNAETRTSEATDTVAATKPGVPGHLNVFPHDTGALDVYWEDPVSDGGSDITGYKVQWKESADSWDTPADVSEATASGTIHTITGLTDGVEYSVRVLATNGVGDSPPSVEQTGTPRETKAPEMVRPRVDGATLKVLYDEALDEGSAPPTDAFDVRVACTCDDTTWLDEEAKRAVESVSVDGDTVVLTLVSAATSEDVVVVSYTPPSGAATARTRDLAGNAAAGFISTEVFNDTDETAESEENGEPEETTEGETPLTVSLEATTESHNGTDAFTFEIRFSEEFPLSYKTLRDLAFTVSGGEVLKAQRLDKPSNIRWLITVEPDSNGDVTVVLPVTTDCDADGAVCTEDGRKLSTRLEFTVSGPGQ